MATHVAPTRREVIETDGLSSDLLKPVATALAAVVVAVITAGHWGTQETALTVQAVVTFAAGYLISPTANLGAVGKLFDKLNLSRKLVAAVVVAIGTALVTYLATGHWNDAEVNALVMAGLGLVLAAFQQKDRLKTVTKTVAVTT